TSSVNLDPIPVCFRARQIERIISRRHVQLAITHTRNQEGRDGGSSGPAQLDRAIFACAQTIETRLWSSRARPSPSSVPQLRFARIVHELGPVGLGDMRQDAAFGNRHQQILRRNLQGIRGLANSETNRLRIYLDAFEPRTFPPARKTERAVI